MLETVVNVPEMSRLRNDDVPKTIGRKAPTGVYRKGHPETNSKDTKR